MHHRLLVPLSDPYPPGMPLRGNHARAAWSSCRAA